MQELGFVVTSLAIFASLKTLYSADRLFFNSVFIFF